MIFSMKVGDYVLHDNFRNVNLLSNNPGTCLFEIFYIVYKIEKIEHNNIYLVRSNGYNEGKIFDYLFYSNDYFLNNGFHIIDCDLFK